MREKKRVCLEEWDPWLEDEDSCVGKRKDTSSTDPGRKKPR